MATRENFELLQMQGAKTFAPSEDGGPLKDLCLVDLEEEKVSTILGDVVVHKTGNKKKPAIVTFHDIGQNAHTCFQGFFQFSEMATLSEKFFIIHVNAPGQELDAAPLPDEYIYPSMNDLSDMITGIVDHFQIKSFIGFGVGAGANVLCRFALKNPNRVDALILVNCSVTQAGWVEWAYQKMNVSYLLRRGMTTFTVDYLMWHHFGQHWQQIERDLVREYYQHFCRLPNPRNLAAFIEAYIARTDLEISRDGDTLSCPVLQLVGQGPHIEETVDTNSKLDPAKSNWIKLADCGGMVLDEAPDRVTEAIMLFLQGEGYLSSICHLFWQAEWSERSLTLQPSNESMNPTLRSLRSLQSQKSLQSLKSHLSLQSLKGQRSDSSEYRILEVQKSNSCMYRRLVEEGQRSRSSLHSISEMKGSDRSQLLAGVV